MLIKLWRMVGVDLYWSIILIRIIQEIEEKLAE